MDDTIFALASARGKAGVSVIRVSGPDAFKVSRQLSGCEVVAGRVKLCSFRNSEGQVIDRGLLLGFAEGASFTGESVVEFQVHGSPAVLNALFQELSHLGLRVAEPGEFTRRALENDRMDLIQVEGLADLIDAETEAQRKLAIRVSSGEASDLVVRWRNDLIRAAALTEATIDFSDEDIPDGLFNEVKEKIHAVRTGIQYEINGYDSAECIREGFEIAIVGEPNVGKSTLLNRLARREAAITSEIAGTTRDIIEVKVDMGGIAATWLDTAGIHESDDVVESIGIERAISRATEADLRVFLLMPGQETPIPKQPDDLILTAKQDIHGGSEGISGLTGAGVDELIARVREILERRAAAAGLMSHRRHMDALHIADGALGQAEEMLEPGEVHAEIVAEYIRSASHELAQIVGLVNVEDLLDEIFSSFCIGK